MISIIIPCYNASNHILRCLDSILKSKDDDFEIILVNDGSTDHTLKVCEDLATRYKNIVVFDKPNGGASSARNMGISLAKGEYLMFLDSDDYWKSADCLLKIKRKLLDKTSIDIILFGVENFNSISKSISQRVKFSETDISFLDLNSFQENIVFLHRKNKFPSSAWSLVVRKSLLIENSLFFKEGIVAEDIDWMIELMKTEPKISAIEDNFYRYHKLREGSVTSSSSIKAVSSLIYIFDKWLPRLNSNNIIDLTLLKFLSFHSATLFLAFSKLSTKEKSIYLNSVKKNIHLLSYNNSTRVLFVRVVVHIFGIELGSNFLNKIYSLYLRFE